MFKYFKGGVSLAIIVFILMVLRQLIFSDKIYWIDAIGVSVTVVIAYMFIEWARKPYVYNKDKK